MEGFFVIFTMMRILYYALAIAACFVLGYSLNEFFFRYSKSLLVLGIVPLENRTIQDKDIGAIVLGLAFGLLPLFHLLMVKASKLNTAIKHSLSMALVLTSGLIFWRLRIFGLNTELKQLNDYIASNKLPLTPVAVTDLKFDIYLLMGFLVGALIAILIFRDKSAPLIRN
ncbi:hypothetical protein [uncultured Winogradskyella sp.]|uniref:hypothetical protein n=1 Tax=uncultured Winogradskyella sp. TaxID=395353 RepID=UPI003516B9BF